MTAQLHRQSKIGAGHYRLTFGTVHIGTHYFHAYREGREWYLQRGHDRDETIEDQGPFNTLADARQAALRALDSEDLAPSRTARRGRPRSFA